MTDSTLVQQYAQDGYVVLHDAFDAQTIAQLQQLETLCVARTLNRRGRIGNAAHKLYRTENLLHDFLVPALINNKTMLNFIEAVSKEQRHINEILLYFSQPNGRLQRLHRDVNHVDSEAYVSESPLIAVQVPLVDFNVENGGTRLVKGSHRWLGKVPSLEEEQENGVESLIPTVPVGACLVRDARAWHGAGSNKSTGIRSMFTLAFRLGEVASNAKAVSSDVYFNLSQQAQSYVVAPAVVHPFMAYGAF